MPDVIRCYTRGVKGLVSVHLVEVCEFVFKGFLFSLISIISLWAEIKLSKVERNPNSLIRATYTIGDYLYLGVFGLL